MIAFFRKALRMFEDVIWPRRVICLLCEERSYGEWLCEECAKSLEVLRVEHESGNIRSAYWYADAAKGLVTSLKFEAMKDAASALAPAMVEAAQDMELPPDTVVTWVTMPDRRRLERGIDHGRCLASAVARELGLPLQQLLKRARRVPTQRGLTLEERKRNLIGAFTCASPVTRPVLLVDDVLTTGATTVTCANVLIEAGAPAVYVITATKVAPRKS